MASQVMQFDSESYPAVKSLIATQRVKLEVTAEVVSNSGGSVILKINSVSIASKSKLSTQEVLLQNMNENLEKIRKEQSTAKPTP